MSPEKQIWDKELVNIDKNILIKLRPETVEILNKAQKAAGMPIRVEWGVASEFDRGDFGEVAGFTDGGWKKRDICPIKCNPERLQDLNHIIVHEALHILRQRELPLDKFKKVVVLEKNVLHILETKPQIGKELDNLIKKNLLSESKKFDFFYNWVREIVYKLGSTPEDMRIDALIWDRYEFLQEEQLRLLVSQTWGIKELISENSEFKQRSPSTFYSPWLTLQIPRTFYAGIIFKEIMGEKLSPELDFLQEIKKLKEFQIGSKFLSDVFEESNGLVGSQRLTDRWAQKLGIANWYTWIRPEELKEKELL